MKKLLLLLFVLGLISCGGQKQEEPAVEEAAPESVMPADTAAVDTAAVDTMATEMQE
jgi:hypothetical protein